MPHPLSGQEILFTRQRHEAKRAGLHWDYRLVLGDKAYSWATKKEMPEPGKATILFEQPVHDREYALSKVVEIPDGEYGAGITKLDWVRKAKIEPETEEDKLVLTSGQDRFLLKKLDPVKYGDKAWLFKRLNVLQKQSSYEEGPWSTFDHDGKEYFVDHAISESKKSPVLNIPVKDLTWVMKYGVVEPERLKVADVKYPVLVTKYKDKLVVIDGLHRLTKAKQLNLSTIPTRYVDMNKIPSFKKVSNRDIKEYKERLKMTGNKYLEKLAEKEKSRSSWNNPFHLIGGATLGNVVAAPMMLGGMAATESMRSSINKPMPDIADRHTVKHFMRNNNFNKGNMEFEHKRTPKGRINLDFSEIFNGGRAPAYLNKDLAQEMHKTLPRKFTAGLDAVKKDKVIGLGGKDYNHAITMHELGHAKDFNTGMGGLKRGLAHSKLPLKLGGGALTIGMLSNEKTQDYAPLVPGALAAIHLREEGAANYHAYKGIKAHKGAAAANKFLTKIVPKQMAGYAGVLGAPVLGAYVASKLLHKIRENEQ